MTMDRRRPRPSVFIGSSSEGLEIARAVQANLDDAAETTLWSQGVFGLSEGTLESLVDRSQDFDFAILVLTPDDLIESRTKRAAAPRDNVLFELGLFTGCLGRQRTFVVHDRTAGLKLPSDLAGVTAATFQPHAVENWLAALGPACTRMADSIRKLGPRTRPVGAAMDACAVEIYFHKRHLKKEDAEQIARDLGQQGMRCTVRSHMDVATPDAAFIGCLVTPAEARAALNLLPYRPRYLFPIDFPESEGGDLGGRKIGLGYWSDYNLSSRAERSRPSRVTEAQLRQLLSEGLTMADFHRLLHDLTTGTVVAATGRPLHRAMTRRPGRAGAARRKETATANR